MQDKIDCNKISEIREERNANSIYTGSDVAPCGACRPWIFFINGVLCFLNFNGSRMEKKKSLEETPLQEKDESRRSSPP